MEYDFGSFINRVKDSHQLEIIEAADKACRAPESASYGVKGAIKARQAGSTRYVESLKKFLGFMYTQLKPSGVSWGDFVQYKMVAENLVKKGEWKPEVLKLFD